MGESPGVFLVLVAGGILLGGVGCAVADECAGIQPVICADGHRHESKCRKGPHGGQQHLDASFPPNHRRAWKETDV